MVELRMKNYKVTEEENVINYKDITNPKDAFKITGIKVNDDFLGINNIPYREVADARYYFLNKNNTDYFVLASFNLIKTFIITFAVGKNGIEIDNVELSIKFADRFKNYIVPSNELFCNALKFELIEALKYLPFSEREIEWYKAKIEEYTERYDSKNKMEVSLSGGFKINGDEMPVTETFTPQEQSLTLKGNKLNFPLEFRGKIYQTLKEICKDYDIKYSTVWGRINEQGYSLEKAIYTEIAPRSKRRAKNKKNNGTYNSIGITYKGKYYPSISKLAEEYGIARATLANRLSKGWDIDRAVNEPPQEVGRNVLK